MGSMTKVMEKLQAAEAGPDADAVAAGAAAGGFVAEGAGGEAGAGPGPGELRAAADTRTCEWDPRKVDPAVVAFRDRYSAICEQFRSIRARLLTMNTARAAQAIAITSAIPEEGKSVSAVNLALTMAEGGEHRIVVADADFRRTSLARMLGVPPEPGLAEVLHGDVSLEQALQPTPLPNLRLLTAGRVRDNAYAELLGSSNLPLVLNQLRDRFDYTFLDTPPVTTVSDVCLLAPHCDGAIVVIQMRRTPEPTVQQAVRTLQANNVKVLGTILSRFRERGAGSYEHYYSSYYYR
jgi:receptor protein-tyrosine kinase